MGVLPLPLPPLPSIRMGRNGRGSNDGTPARRKRWPGKRPCPLVIRSPLPTPEGVSAMQRLSSIRSDPLEKGGALLLATLFLAIFLSPLPRTLWAAPQQDLSERLEQEGDEIRSETVKKAKQLAEKGKKEAKAQVERILEDEERRNAITRVIALLGFGGVTGFILGFTIKKMVKVVIVVLGIFLLSLQGLVYLDWATIHWEKIKTTVWPFFEDHTLSEKLMTFLTAQFPYAGGMSAGLYLGFKKG
ncbi:MAG: hypothetical protein D6795_03695 [Deltaproteobacteria bacterium]|nr:MAG: hypothetical protein D6795_03695 [Deltaproteobacteria bacterium]